MKKIFAPLLLVSALLYLSACSEKFNVAAPYKSITVVYGILQRSDTAQYIRIQKAFLDENKNALVMAKEPDSNFFSTLDVKLKVFNFNGGLISTIPLTRVMLDSAGVEKEPGTFFTTPNYAYKFNSLLNPDAIYRLVIYNSASGETDSAEAPVIDDINNRAFTVYYIDDTNKNLKGLDFTSTNQYQKVPIVGRYAPPSSFKFNDYTSPVSIVQSFLRFHYTDSNTTSGVTTKRYFDMGLGYIGLLSNTFTYEVKNVEIYNAIGTGLGVAPANTVRLMGRCEMFFYLGTPDFNTYIQIASIQGTGLTGSEIQPTYTNLKGKNVLGLFTSRGLRHGYITLTRATLNALKTESMVAHTRIVGGVSL